MAATTPAMTIERNRPEASTRICVIGPSSPRATDCGLRIEFNQAINQQSAICNSSDVILRSRGGVERFAPDAGPGRAERAVVDRAVETPGVDRRAHALGEAPPGVLAIDDAVDGGTP